MQLSVQSLAEQGAFVGALVEKEITWRGKKATVYVRPLSYFSAVAEVSARRDNKDVLASRIAACIFQQDGTPVFTVEDITGEADPGRGPLDEDLTFALLEAIGEVSGLGKSRS